MIADNKVGVVIVYRLDRLSRNVSDIYKQGNRIKSERLLCLEFQPQTKHIN
jgi:DNA invertase Pin-like site-specific DNA recombinase